VTSSGSQSGITFEIWCLFTKKPGVEDGEVLTEEKGDPDAVSAEIFHLWMVDGADKKGERVWLDESEWAHLSGELEQVSLGGSQVY
jgi:hypothetical protein